VGKLSGFFYQNFPRNKKGLYKQAFYQLQAFLHRCRKKAFEENPLLPSGQSLLVSESPIEVGVSDPSRPDFPEYRYRFFQTLASYTHTAGVSPQYRLYQIARHKSIAYRLKCGYLIRIADSFSLPVWAIWAIFPS